MKIGTKVLVYCQDTIGGARAVRAIIGKLVGETPETVTIARKNYCRVIKWQNIISLERWEEVKKQ